MDFGAHNNSLVCLWNKNQQLIKWVDRKQNISILIHYKTNKQAKKQQLVICSWFLNCEKRVKSLPRPAGKGVDSY